MEPAETTVWMVHARTTSAGVKGTLRLEPSALVFRPTHEDADEMVFPLERVKRARRVLGSPVLEVRLSGGTGPAMVGFYFVRPPNLEMQREGRFFARGKAKRDAAVALVTSNLSKKEEIALWARSIREAKRKP
ncbi:MAG: hypothetical protein ABR518_05285 [Actinomycetota bacterium]